MSKFKRLFVCNRKKEKIATGCAVDTSVRQKTGIFAKYYNEKEPFLFCLDRDPGLLLQSPNKMRLKF